MLKTSASNRHQTRSVSRSTRGITFATIAFLTMLTIVRAKPWIQEKCLQPLLFNELAHSRHSFSQILLAIGADPNGTKGQDPLQWSIFINRADSVALLLRCGADPNQKTGKQYPLNAAFELDQLQAAALLLKYGANPYLTDDFGITGWQSATFCTDPVAVKMLVNAGVDPNVSDLGTGYTWLMMEVLLDDLPAVKALVDRGADPLRADHSGATAIDCARRHGHTKILKYLRSKVSFPPNSDPAILSDFRGFSVLVWCESRSSPADRKLRFHVRSEPSARESAARAHTFT